MEFNFSSVTQVGILFLFLSGALSYSEDLWADTKYTGSHMAVIRPDAPVCSKCLCQSRARAEVLN